MSAASRPTRPDFVAEVGPFGVDADGNCYRWSPSEERGDRYLRLGHAEEIEPDDRRLRKAIEVYQDTPIADLYSEWNGTYYGGLV